MLTRIANGLGLPADKSHPFDPEAKLPMIRCAMF